MNVRTRIAPSPTGFPHIGTVFQALIDYVYAKHHQGKFIVRIEDTDKNRYVQGSEEAIFQAFDWVGIKPDEGPLQGGKYGPYKQSQRLNIYKKYADELIKKNLAYYCFCSPERLEEVRRSMQQMGQPPMYDKHCRNLDQDETRRKAEKEKHVVRMKIPQNESITLVDEVRGKITFDSNTIDDQVLLKSDGYPTYHLAVVVDDHLMKITHVVRGEEWISSSPKHVLLYQYFRWNMPKFIHTPLLRNPDKSKLGKRHGHASVKWYQDEGYLPEAVINFLITRVWNHPEGKEVFGMDEIIEHFDFSDMHIQGPIADLNKLNWLNGLYIRNTSKEKLYINLVPFLPKEATKEIVVKIIPLIQERIHTLKEFGEYTDFFFQKPTLTVDAILKQSKQDEKATASKLIQVMKRYSSLQKNKFITEQLENETKSLLDSIWTVKKLFMTIRVAVTGKPISPPLFESLEILGKEEVLNRLNDASTYLQKKENEEENSN